MNEFIVQKKKEFEDKFKCGCSHLGEPHTDAKFPMKDFTDFLESALQVSYSKGVEDAIKTVKQIETYTGDPTPEAIYLQIIYELEQLKEQQ